MTLHEYTNKVRARLNVLHQDGDITDKVRADTLAALQSVKNAAFVAAYVPDNEYTANASRLFRYGMRATNVVAKLIPDAELDVVCDRMWELASTDMYSLLELEEPEVELVQCTEAPIQEIARAARVCYKSEPDGEYADSMLVRKLIERGHHAMLEFANATFCIRTDRGITHELVRHRVASFAQESSRYVNFAREKFGSTIRCMVPSGGTAEWELRLRRSLVESAACYMDLIAAGAPPQWARAALPTCAATTIVVQMNFRELRHFFGLRCATAAHPDMQIIAKLMLDQMREKCPEVFSSL